LDINSQCALWCASTSQDFKLHSIVLSFAKHKGGCTGQELQEQLFDSILSRQLCIAKFVDCVTNTAANMNKIRDYVFKQNVAHHYCGDHIIQLTAEKAFSTGSCVS
jgi:hypothetical protein